MVTELSLKVFIDKQKSKIIFGEANHQFVDVLLSFLALPLGRISKVLKWLELKGEEGPFLGSLDTLHRSLYNMDHLFCDQTCHAMLYYPICSLEDELSRIKLDITESYPTKFYVCENDKCAESHLTNICMKYTGIINSYDAVACDCGMTLNREEDVCGFDAAKEGVLTTTPSSFIVFDDLRVVPSSNGFSSTLNDLCITDLDEIEMVTLNFDIFHMLSFFKFALFSTTPLTDFVRKNLRVAAGFNYFPRAVERPVSSNSKSKTMILKVFLQKSTVEFLFAEAKAEFVEFLFSLLAIPIGRVEHLFGGSTPFNSIDNLYRSVKDEIDHEYFRAPCKKDMLINPKLPYGFNLRSQILIPAEETPPAVYVRKENDSIRLHRQKRGKLVSLKSNSVGEGYFVKEITTCILSDDLSVKPYSVESSVSLLKSRGILLSDVKEMEFQIGYEEALRILKAALTSTTVFTNALIYPMLFQKYRI